MEHLSSFPFSKNSDVMKNFFAFIFFCFAMAAVAQPATEVLLFDVRKKSGGLAISNGKNISNNKGYDSQPSFDPRSSRVLYSSARQDGRTDIRSYDWKTGVTTELTQTSEREYSPVVTPDGKNFSCIIQRDNGAQDLGAYPLAGGPPEILIDHLTIGYHAWLSSRKVIAFVLGEPHTLRLLVSGGGEELTLASNIGRSLHKIPGVAEVSFIDKSDPAFWRIKKVDAKSHAISEIAPCITGHEDIAWFPDGRILSSDGARLFWLDSAKGKWTPVEGPELKGITRIAVSPDGRKLAVVVEE